MCGRYDDADILAGQGTVGVEVIDQMKDIEEPLDAIVVPVGGGGLIAGVSVAMKQLSPNTEVIVRCTHKLCIFCGSTSLVLLPVINTISCVRRLFVMYTENYVA